MKIKVSLSPNLNELQELDLSLPSKRRGEWIVGRSPDSDLILDSSDVSRIHGKFFLQGGNYYFSDLGSRNGSIINGKEAETNQAYILRDGDIIRIGDFILMMEEIVPISQQAETVVRIINPSVFSNWRSTENADKANVVNQSESQEVKTPVAEPSTPISSEVKTPEQEVKTPVAEPSTPISSEVKTPEIDAAASLKVDEDWSEPTFIQSEDTYIQPLEDPTPESTIQPSEEVSKEEVTPEVVSGVVPEIGEFSDFTYVQPRDLLELSEERNIAQSTPQPQEVVSESIEVHESIDYTIVQPRDLTDEFPEERVTLQSTSSSAEPASEAPPVVEPEQIHAEAPPVVEHEEINAEAPPVVEHEEISEAITISVSESVSEAAEVSSLTIEQEVAKTEETVYDEISSEESEYPESLAEKRIVLIAHETQKSELAEFVTEHQKLFSLCHTITWSSVSEVLHQQAGINVSEQIPPGTSGGYQTIASMVNSGDISAVIFLRDFLQPQPGQANEEAMLRLCNINQVLLATNIVTAEAIVHYLKYMDE